jgi:DNA-binding NarL/FixJ family response regulator
MINIAIIGSYDLEREGIERILTADPDMNVLPAFTNEQELLQDLSKGIAIDVILYSLNTTVPGFSFVTDIKVLSDDTNVILLASDNTPKYVQQAFRYGARGYLLKNVRLSEIIFAIKHIYNGYIYISADLGIQMVPHLEKASVVVNAENLHFSIQDLKLLKLLSEGMNTQEISAQLQLNTRTVEGYRRKLYQKASVKNTAGLIKFALVNGVID